MQFDFMSQPLHDLSHSGFWHPVPATAVRTFQGIFQQPGLMPVKGQGHGSNFRVTRSKNVFFCTLRSPTGNMLMVKGHLGQGQRGSWSKVIWVKVKEGHVIGQGQGHQIKK